MKVAVVGSRNLWVEDLGHFLPEGTTEIVSGGAKGIDTFAREYAQANGIPLTEFLPEYKKYGRGAPFRRNISIIEHADLVVAFWDGASRGTRFVMDECVKRGKPVKAFVLLEKTPEEKAGQLFREDLKQYGQGAVRPVGPQASFSEKVKAIAYPALFHLCKWEQEDREYVELGPESWDAASNLIAFSMNRLAYDEEEAGPPGEEVGNRG